jgi:hypothetical protein
VSTPLEIKLHAALKRIAAYQTPAQIRRSADRDYGLHYEEALEMAYDNIQHEAKLAIKGVRIKL